MSQPQQSNATQHNSCNKQSNATIIIDLCPFGLHIKPPQRTGLSGAPTLVALTSEESHYSIVKVTRAHLKLLPPDCTTMLIEVNVNSIHL